MPYRGFSQKPPPVKMAWIVATLIALVAIGAIGFGLAWGLFSLVTLLF